MNWMSGAEHGRTAAVLNMRVKYRCDLSPGKMAHNLDNLKMRPRSELGEAYGIIHLI